MNTKDKDYIEQMTEPFYRIATAIEKLANVLYDTLGSYETGQALDSIGQMADSIERIANELGEM